MSQCNFDLKNRKTISIEEKLELRNRLEKGEHIANICHALGAKCVKFIIMLIELKKVFREEIKRVLKEFSYSRTSTMELREKLENQNQCYVPVS
jgi:hypothetical protein